MFELALSTIKEKIQSEKSTLDYYEKEYQKFLEYHRGQIIKIDSLQREFDSLRKKLGLDEETA